MGELYRQLAAYKESDYYPFHMPGHKRDREAAEGALGSIYGLDITEIDGFDNLHQPRGILEKAQKRAAEIYGAEKTWFLVNGSTCGILSAILAATNKGGRLLMARNCHRSAYHGAFLQELETTYVYPAMIEGWGIVGSIAPEDVERALARNPDIGAVIITSPTYEGIVSDIKKIADITHKHGKPLIVDEAHGAHFGFHQAYPQSSVRLGADVVVHSLHKTLPSMTQTALLHLCGSLIPAKRLERYLGIFQTSSPSYVLMASMDSCMDLLEREGRKRLEGLLEMRRDLIGRLEGCRHLRLLDASLPKGERLPQTDPCKLAIASRDAVLSGWQIYDILREKYHLQMEMGADQYALAILTMMDTKDGLDRLSDALLKMDKEAEEKESATKYTEGIKAYGDAKKAGGTVMAIAQAYGREWERIRLAEGCGRIAAEFIGLYPPGIPLAVPGERLSGDMIGLLMRTLDAGKDVQGIENGYIRVIKVKKNMDAD